MLFPLLNAERLGESTSLDVIDARRASVFTPLAVVAWPRSDGSGGLLAAQLWLCSLASWQNIVSDGSATPAAEAGISDPPVGLGFIVAGASWER